jgi:hypothetical protein
MKQTMTGGWFLAAVTLLAVGCGGGGDQPTERDGGVSPGPVDAGAVQPVDAGAADAGGVPPGPVDAGAVRPVDAGAAVVGCPTQTEIVFNSPTRGTTTVGWTEDLTRWFAQSNVACAPATMSARFPAPFAVFSLPVPRASDWDVVVTPDAGVDVNLITWTQSPTDTSCYPTRGIGVVSCDYSTSMGGPGAAETTRVNATTNPYRLVILVTTPQGGTRGGFSVTVRPHA